MKRGLYRQKAWFLLTMLLLCLIIFMLLAACDSEGAGEQVGEGIAKGQEEAQKFSEGVKKGYENQQGSGCATVIVPFLLVSGVVAFRHKPT